MTFLLTLKRIEPVPHDTGRGVFDRPEAFGFSLGAEDRSVADETGASVPQQRLGCIPPDDTCRSSQTLHASPARFTAALIAPVHRENIILFPRFETATDD